MSAPKLTMYVIGASPPAAAVQMLAELLGLKIQLKDIDLLKYEHKSEEYKKLNPMGTVPTLVDGDFVVSESHTILMYLLEKYGGDKKEQLYPSDPKLRSLINTCMFFDTGVLFIRIKVIALAFLFDGLPRPTARHLADIDDAYPMVEDYLSRHKYIAADHITLADLSVGATVGTMDVYKKLDSTKFPLIAAWLARLNKEPWFQGPISRCITASAELMKWKTN